MDGQAASAQIRLIPPKRERRINEKYEIRRNDEPKTERKKNKACALPTLSEINQDSE